ncbi:protein suppressor of forked-like isoform X2 [Penaeus chinensis]|uniref:protein suppressor of forked-like isoform X2 n=1 Tax=Penaeus chinensis TaxID=139456 RepID=UPI001FB80A08|nr:protein suppressor of forked-like isoform X2 [Penaeus chinensis]
MDETPEFGTEKLRRAWATTESNPHDMEAWSLIIRDAQNRAIDSARPIFERLVTTFPTTGKFWKMYIEQEMRSYNFEKVEKLFQRCLTKVLNIDLWRLYVTYVKETKSSLPTYREKLSQAYEFATDKIGMDYNSYTLWNDYANLLKNVEVVGSYAENQKIMAVRKVYQRGIVTPMANIEQLWKDYLDFEKNINPIIAEKMNIERGRDYMNARRVGKELETETRGLNRHLPSVPPSGLPEETKQVEIWKRYIRWEKDNPLRTDDQTLVTKRVRFAYEQCLLCLSYHPDIWYEAALFLQESSKLLSEKGDVNASKIFSEEAAQIYERAISGPLRRNQLLYFAYADFEESRLRYQEVHKIYQRYIEMEDIDPTLAYLQYMKFARRAEGIKSTREVFKKAREDIRTKFHIYVGAALMEYYCTKNKDIAFRIFELGLKKCPDNADYIMAYVDYLSHLNDDNNTRVLFERVLTSGQLKNEDTVGLWNRFLEFECNVGDLASIVKVEKRRAHVLQKLQEFEGKDTAQLVDRYKFMDLYPCTPPELKAIGYRDISTHNMIINPNVPRGLSIHDSQEPTYARPDFSQMIPFKPKAKYIPGEHPVKGGAFPPPPAVANLLSMLPPPHCFRGPFVKLDALVDLFMRLNLPEQGGQWSTTGSHDVRLFELSKSVHWVVDPSGDRKRKLVPGDDSDDEDGNKPVLTSDIYRARQQKRMKIS